MRTTLLSALLFAACGSSTPGTMGQPTPMGMHNHMVVSEVDVPQTSDQARSFGLDLGQPTSNKPDGTVDNQLGNVLSALKGQGFDVQTTLTTAVNAGTITLLVDFQTQDFTSTSAAGMEILFGLTGSGDITPAPCNGSADTTCGNQLKGTGMFMVDPNSPTDAVVAGPIVGGTFNGGPGTITLELALGGTTPVQLNLLGARGQATGISATGITQGIIAGALTQDDLNTQVIPAIQAQLAPIITRDCTSTDPNATPPCGCADGSTGKTLIGLFDTDPKDCMVSVMEIQENTLIKSLLAPDVCSTASCAKPDALSLGVQFKAVAGTYTVAGE